MNCKDVINKLPEYLAGLCNLEEKLEISKHISSCSDCMKVLEELDEPVLNITKPIKSPDIGKLLSKARKALILKVTAIALLSVMIFISTFFVVIPGIYKTVRYPDIPDVTRALTDITQFTSPLQVGGYGNSLASFGKYSFTISAYTNDITGIRRKNSAAVDRNFDMITGTFESTAPHIAQFIHPEVAVSDEFLKERTPSAAKKMLGKNADTTVATVDLSLNSTISLKAVADSLKDLDIRVVWMAVECGSEKEQPKNMSAGQNQYIQWGIPGKLFSANNTDSTEFSSPNLSKYEKEIVEELKWLDKNKKYISPDKSLRKFQGLDNSVGNRAKYILDNGFKVYGIRITGPSSQLIKLENTLDIRFEEVKDIDFYYWN